MKNVLFVCHGNICRSPMAEYYFRRIVERAGLSEVIYVESAAVSKEEVGNPVYPLARRMLAGRGIVCKDKVARVIVADDYNRFDYIVAMDESNLKALPRLVGKDVEHKFSLLLDHTSPEDKDHHNRDVQDPWYTRRFDKAWEDITIGCDALLKELRSLVESEENV